LSARTFESINAESNHVDEIDPRCQFHQHSTRSSICTDFLYFQFGFVIFFRKDIGTKAVGKMLVKLTTGEAEYDRPPPRQGREEKGRPLNEEVC
jgi:hypothetical protein